MPTTSTCSFAGSRGTSLSARIERPDGPPRATALFVHCFTCSKDLRVERQLTAALTAEGFAVLSFDFAGLGRSGGDFADSTFAADVDDVVAAARYLADEIAPPSLLVGHSLGGAAVLSAATGLPEVRAVATLGAPADPQHIEHALDGDLDAVRRDGTGTVSIAGRQFTVSQQFIEQLSSAPPLERIAQFKGAVLLMHAPQDQTVGIENAELLYRSARHPKSFVSLDRTDHLVTDAADAAYAASVIAAWSQRYLPAMAEPRATYDDVGARATNRGGFTTALTTRGFSLVADEPSGRGGTELGPTPYDFLAASLAACTVMTLRSYADRKDWPIGELDVTVTHSRVHADDCQNCEKEGGTIDRFERILQLPEGLTPEQCAALVRIADRCPVHRTLEGRIEVTTLVSAPPTG